MEKRIDYLKNLYAKRLQITEYLQSVNVFDVSKIFTLLKDVFHMYGFSQQDVKRFINYNGDFSEYSTNELIQIDGVANSLLHHLKRISRQD